MDVESMQEKTEHLLFKSECSAWKHGRYSLYCSLTVFFIYMTWLPLWFKIFSYYIITDSAAPTKRCRNLSAVLQFHKVHPVCCWWCWPKRKFIGRPNKFHGMEPYRVGPHAGESYSKLWKWMSYKLLTTFRSAISLHYSQKHEIPKSSIALTLQHHIVSGKRHSHIIPGLKKQAVHSDLHSSQSAVYLMPW